MDSQCPSISRQGSAHFAADAHQPNKRPLALGSGTGSCHVGVRQECGSARGSGSRGKVKPKRVAARTVAVLVMVASTPSSSTQLPAGALGLGSR